MSISINYDDNTMIAIKSNVNVIPYKDIQSSNSKIMYDGKTYSLNQIWLINNGADHNGHVVLVNQYTDYETTQATTYYFYIDLINDGNNSDPSGGMYAMLNAMYAANGTDTTSVSFAMNKYLLNVTNPTTPYTIKHDKNNNCMVSIKVSSYSMKKTSQTQPTPPKTLPDYKEIVDNIKFETSGDNTASQIKNCKLVGTSGKKSIGSDPNYPEIKKGINIAFLVVFFVGLFVTIIVHLFKKPLDTDFFGYRLAEDLPLAAVAGITTVGNANKGGMMKGGNCNFIGDLSSPAPKIGDFFKTTAMLFVVVLLTYGIKSNVDFLITAVVFGVVLPIIAVSFGVSLSPTDVSFHSVMMVSPTFPAAKWTAVVTYFLAYTTFMRIIQKTSHVQDPEMITFIVNFLALVALTAFLSRNIGSWWIVAAVLIILISLPAIVISIDKKVKRDKEEEETPATA